jgi:hypothetical protein
MKLVEPPILELAAAQAEASKADLGTVLLVAVGLMSKL